MDEFLQQLGLQRLKPVEWQVLVLLIGHRNGEPQSLRPLERSEDAIWRATRALESRGWIEPVPNSSRGLWRLTPQLRERLNQGDARKPAPQAEPRVVPSEPPAPDESEQRSFSSEPPPEPPPPRRPDTPEKPPPRPEPEPAPPEPKPPVEGFLGRPREIQREALRQWKRSLLREDLLRHVLDKLQDPGYVHPDLADALDYADRWADRITVKQP